MLPILLSALPLLGLLGTITGLLTTFRAMADSDELEPGRFRQQRYRRGAHHHPARADHGHPRIAALLVEFRRRLPRAASSHEAVPAGTTGAKNARPGIDMAPLIDMVFILLIFFIVTSDVRQ